MSILKSVFNSIDVLGGLFFEEPEVARFLTIPESADGFTIPDPVTQINDRHIPGIHAPGLVPGSRSVIFFRTRNTGTPTFAVRPNSTSLTQHSFNDAGPKSWHEIVPSGALKPQDNELTLFVQGEGAVNSSDIVILYTSNQLTVRRPIVVSATFSQNS